MDGNRVISLTVKGIRLRWNLIEDYRRLRNTQEQLMLV
jgi:hypothetical protein